MTPEDTDMVRARASQLSAPDVTVALVLLYSAFLDGAEESQAVGVLTHRGLTESEARKVYALVQKVTA